MRIVLTGGGTGGHFYPLLAVADSIQDIVKTERLVPAEIYFVSDSPFSEGLLYEHGVRLKIIKTGKLRRYFSIKNISDAIRTPFAIIKAIFFLFRTYPDVVFGKGGYASFPTIWAARFLNIPVVIHESDTVPGRVNLWAGKFADRIAVSYKEASKYFPEKKVAWTGNPIRQSIAVPAAEGATEYLHLEEITPTILILGGSLGSEKINDVILQALPDIVKNYQVIHQTGRNNFDSVSSLAAVILQNNEYKSRYKVFAYLDDLALRMAAGAAHIVVTRAGSALFEIAAWGVPAIVVPITDSNGDHQRENAFAFSRAGACTVIEESNLTPHVLVSEMVRLTTDKEAYAKMQAGAKSFTRLDASHAIAKELISIALAHEQ